MAEVQKQQPAKPAPTAATSAAAIAQPKTASPAAAPVVPPSTAQQPTLAAKPEPVNSPPKFRVTCGDVSEVIEARDVNEAWALFNDKRKTWPGPKVDRTVEPVA